MQCIMIYRITQPYFDDMVTNLISNREHVVNCLFCAEVCMLSKACRLYVHTEQTLTEG